jgi:hypothetical protein
MSRVTTIITGADGKVTTVVMRRSGGCGGCLSIFAAILVVTIPAATFGPVGAVLAYAGLGVVLSLGGAGWLMERSQRTAPTHDPAPPRRQSRGRRLAVWLRHRRTPQPPPVPWPPPLP